MSPPGCPYDRASGRESRGRRGAAGAHASRVGADVAAAQSAVECRPGLGRAHERPRPLHRVESHRVPARVGVGGAQGPPVREPQRRGIRVGGHAEHLVGGIGERTVGHGLAFGVRPAEYPRRLDERRVVAHTITAAPVTWSALGGNYFVVAPAGTV